MGQEWVQYRAGALCRNSLCCHERGKLLEEFGSRGSSPSLGWVYDVKGWKDTGASPLSSLLSPSLCPAQGRGLCP